MPPKAKRKRPLPSGNRKVPKPSYEETDLGSYETTAYGPPWGGINGQGIATACGVKIGGKAPQVYAVAAPIDIPCGTLLKCNPNPFTDGDYVFVVWDRGGAIVGKRLDFYDWRGRNSQLEWGRQEVSVTKVGKIKLSSNPEKIREDMRTYFGQFDSSQANTDPFGIGSIGDALAAIVQFIARLFEPSFWVRVGKAILGAGALLIGTVLLGRALLNVDIAEPTRAVARGAARGATAPVRERAKGAKAERKRAARERGKLDERVRANRQWRESMEQPPF